jgi:hypothetical protein
MTDKKKEASYWRFIRRISKSKKLKNRDVQEMYKKFQKKKTLGGKSSG